MSCSIEDIKRNALASFLEIQKTPEFQKLTSKRFDENGVMKFDYNISKYYNTQKQALIVAAYIRKKITPIITEWSQKSVNNNQFLSWLNVTFSPNYVKLDFIFPKTLQDYYENKIAKETGKNSKFEREISISGELVEKYKQNEERLAEDKPAEEVQKSSLDKYKPSQRPVDKAAQKAKFESDLYYENEYNNYSRRVMGNSSSEYTDTTSNRKEPSDIENSDNVSIFRPRSSNEDIENYKRTCGL